MVADAFSGTAYHGSNAKFTKFDQGKARITNDFFGGGVAYFTKSRNVAISYAKSMSRKAGLPYVYEVVLKLKKVFDVDKLFTGPELLQFVDDPDKFARGAGILKAGQDAWKTLSNLKSGALSLSGNLVFKGLSGGMVSTAKARQKLRALGYDGLRYNGGMNMGTAEKHDVYLAYDASDIHIEKIYSVKQSVKEALILPEPEMNIAREEMPQIAGKDLDEFLDWLRDQGVKCVRRRVKPETLKACQGEFNVDKIKSLLGRPNDDKPVVVSSDGYVMDGNHRWAAALNSKATNLLIVRVDLPILDLLSFGRRYPGSFRRGVSEHVEASALIAG